MIKAQRIKMFNQTHFFDHGHDIISVVPVEKEPFILLPHSQVSQAALKFRAGYRPPEGILSLFIGLKYFEVTRLSILLICKPPLKCLWTGSLDEPFKPAYRLQLYHDPTIHREEFFRSPASTSIS